MDITKYENLVGEINQLVDEKKKFHKINNWLSFRVCYYAITDDKLVESPSMAILKDCQWGYLIISYWEGVKYHWGHPAPTKIDCFISPEGHLCFRKLIMGDISISVGHFTKDFYDYEQFYVDTINGEHLFTSRDGCSLFDTLNSFVPHLSLIQGCRSEEEVNMLIEIKKNNKEKNRREDMVDILMDEIKKLRATINEYEEIFEEIKQKIPSK